jgi:prepilin-type processing-associated H-X9-DG protein
VPIDPGTNKETKSPSDGQSGNIRWRHGKDDQANFLFGDGTVRTLGITKGAPGSANCRGDCLHKYWRPKAPPGFVPQN